MPVAITRHRVVSPPNLLSVFRIIAGIILVYKASLFMRDFVLAEKAIQKTGIRLFADNVETWSNILTYAGLLCGLFIIMGLFTRWAAIIQIPVLIVAVFFVNIKYIGDNIFEFILSMAMLLLLILFAIKGSGPFSADEYFRLGSDLDKQNHKPPPL